MLSAPCDNSPDGLKGQANKMFCSTDWFKEGREVDEHSLSQKKKCLLAMVLKFYIILPINIISANDFKHYFIVTAGFLWGSPNF